MSGVITPPPPPPPTDTTAPTASITSPLTGSTISGTASIAASASDNVGVVKVELYADNILRATDTSAPYTFSLDTTAFTNGSHSLYLKAYDAAGNVGTSATVTVTVSNAATQPVISGVAVSSITQTSAQVMVTTSQPAAVQVMYGTTTSYGITTSASPYLTTIYVNLQNLAPGTTYDFEVIATPQDGSSPAKSSNYTFQTPQAQVLPPVTLSGITGSATQNSASISWTTNVPASSEVKYGVGSPSLIVTGIGLTTSHSLKISGLKKSTTYQYQVISTDASGNVATSNVNSFTTTAKPGKPANFTATNGSVKLSWTDPADAISKIVLMRSTGGYPMGNPTADPKDVLATLPAGSTSYHDTAVTPGITYYYALYAGDPTGVYSDPALVSFTPNGGAPATVPATVYFTRTLTLGDTGSDVLLLQTVLKNLGFFNATTTFTTTFGSATQHGMFLFQAAHLLGRTGYLDPNSRALMNKVVTMNPSLARGTSLTTSPSATTTPVPAAAVKPATTTSGNQLSQNLSLGASGSQVVILQQFLAKDGEYTGEVNGYYGALTQQAVGTFQLKYGIVSSAGSASYGSVGPTTRAKINSLL